MNRLQTHAQVRVVAATEIPAGARSSPFVLNSSIVTAGLGELRKIKGQITVGLSGLTAEISVLSPLPRSCFWPRLVQFAPDCHVQNVRLCRLHPQPDSVVVLQAIRKVEARESLRLWFGEDLLVSALIPPYLSPINIKGGKSYVCDKCGLACEAPNELKLHLALNCGRFSIDTIWTRLASSVPGSEPESDLRPPKSLEARSSLQPQLTLPVDFSNRVIRAPFFVPPLGGGHHFVIRQDPDSTSTTTEPAPAPTRRGESRASERRGLAIAQAQHRVLAEQHAHLESLVSNMGKGKNGHVCLYCGKLYSRKYGLKIHIRTHTGYKPLACKICHRPFGDPSNLNKHVRLHSDGATPYKCDACGKVLVRRRDLERHVQSRHADLIRDSIRSSE